MEKAKLSTREIWERIGLALIFVVLGYLVYVVFSPFRPMLPTTSDYLGRIILGAILLAAALLARKNPRFEKYWQLFFALFIMVVAVSLDYITSKYLLYFAPINDRSAFGSTMQKLNECFIISLVVIAFTLLSGGSLGSIFLQKGKLKLGLIIGLCTFAAAAAGSVPMAELLFKVPPHSLTLEKMLPWIPWLLLFVLLNAFEEELLFRGLFLRKLEPFFGKFLSVFLVALVFTALHIGTTYSSDQRIFIAVTFPLALLWGWIMQKTDAIWASVLFHAGMDLPIIIGIFSSYK